MSLVQVWLLPLVEMSMDCHHLRTLYALTPKSPPSPPRPKRILGELFLHNIPQANLQVVACQHNGHKSTSVPSVLLSIFKYPFHSRIIYMFSSSEVCGVQRSCHIRVPDFTSITFIPAPLTTPSSSMGLAGEFTPPVLENSVLFMEDQE